MGTYRKSISDVEKSGEETDERPGDVGDTGDAETLRVASEKPRGLNEHQNVVVSETGPANVFTSRIKRKRISRGVQCVSIGRHGHAGRCFFNCFRSKARRRGRTQEARRRKASANRFDVGSNSSQRNEVKSSPSATLINDGSRNAIKEEVKSTCDRDTDIKAEKFGKVGEEKTERVTCGNDEELLLRKMQNLHDGEKSQNNDDSKYRGVKINLLERLRRRGALTCKNVSETRRSGSPRESRNHKEEIAGLNYESKRTNGARKCEDNSRNVKVIDRQMDSSNERKTIASDRGNDVNKIKERLDSCIAQLNGIIGDACAIFGNRRNRTKNNGRG